MTLKRTIHRRAARLRAKTRPPRGRPFQIPPWIYDEPVARLRDSLEMVKLMNLDYDERFSVGDTIHIRLKS